MLPKNLLALAVSIVSSLSVSAVSLSRRATTCNGHPELCNKSFGAVSFVGAHNSYAVAVNNLAANQDQDVTQQLNDGIRMLQMQAHNEGGTIRLCHTSCTLFNGGTLLDYLKTVKTWMDGNPNDVVSLLIVNIDNLPPTQFDAVFKSAGVDTISFAPESATIPASGWPTLGSMIDSGKRLVTFIDNQADFTSVPYIIDEFTNIWETAFDVIDPTFDCEVNRTKGDTSTSMYLINHFLDKITFGVPTPDTSKLNVTNAASGPGSLGEQVNTCTAQHSRPPNFLLVDYYEFGGGSVFQVAATINGVQYAPATPAATPKPTTSGTSGPKTSGTNAASAKADLLLMSSRQLVPFVVVLASIMFGALTVL